MKLIILDRDGVINQDSDTYIKSPEEWVPIDGSLKAIARLNHAGYHVYVATNQSGVGRGLFSVETLHNIHHKMVDQIEAHGGHLDAILFCPHTPEEQCHCRKPKPGLFLELSRRLNKCLKDVPSIGDSFRDLQAAKAAEARPILVRTGNGAKTIQEHGDDLRDIPVFDDLADVVDMLISQEAKQS